MLVMNEKKRLFSVLVLSIYLFVVLWFTILNRQVSFHSAQTELFWSYKLWFSGNRDYGLEIFCNIAMFIPLGYLLSTVINRKSVGLIVPLSALLLSLCIELLQLVLMRGLFEWDDVINNVIGSVLGWLLYLVFKKIFYRKYEFGIVFSLNIVLLFFSIGFLFFENPVSEETEDESSKHYCFQIDMAELYQERIVLSGFCFVYEKRPEKLSFVLESQNSGDRIELNTDYGLVREDVNDYFLCNYDYSNVGFTATGIIDHSEEYEILVKFPWSVPVPTGVFLTGDRIHYIKDSELIEPSVFDELLSDSNLLVYRPDYHCWIYQKDECLYWIVDKDFYFEADGTTYIQYQLWTTQIDNLPTKRKERNLNWDNIGGYFEDYELIGNFGSYRIMKRSLPSEYSITTIETGYYLDGKWVWKEYFRPIYKLS